jgi:hypothetical protein
MFDIYSSTKNVSIEYVESEHIKKLEIKNDMEIIQRVLINFLKNSLKFTSEGKI